MSEFTTSAVESKDKTRQPQIFTNSHQMSSQMRVITAHTCTTRSLSRKKTTQIKKEVELPSSLYQCKSGSSFGLTPQQQQHNTPDEIQ